MKKYRVLSIFLSIKISSLFTALLFGVSNKNQVQCILLKGVNYSLPIPDIDILLILEHKEDSFIIFSLRKSK